MDLCNQLFSAGQPPCRAKTLMLDITHKFFSFIPAILTFSIDMYHFMPLSVAFTLAGGHKVSTIQNALA